MTYTTNRNLQFTYEYDFAIDGGAVSVIPMRPVGNAMEIGLTILNIHASVVAAFTGTATPVCVIGNNSDDDGYLADIFAIATLANKFCVGQVAGALLWDDTNDHNKEFLIALAADVTPAIKISTQALTAGKITLVFDCIKY